MKTKNIKIDPSILDKISNSIKITNTEKVSFLKVVGYLTTREQNELVSII